MSETQEDKHMLKILFIYKALESGWTVAKTATNNTFEFTKSSTFKSNKKQIKTERRCISDPIRYNII